MKLKNRKAFYAYLVSAVIIYILVYIPAYHTPFHSDDYVFFLRGISLTGLWNHYLNWEGRLIGDYTASILLCFFNKPIYMAINSLVFLIVIINISLISQLLQGEQYINRHSIILLWLTFLLYWLCNPNLGQTSFWLVGSAIYLWPLMWCSFYMLCLFKLLKDNVSGSRFKNYIKIALLCVLGFFSGLSNEATGAATVFLMLALFFVYFGFSERLKFVLAGSISSLTGFLILVLAPGNFIRLSDPIFTEWRNLPFLDKAIVHILRRMPYAISQFWLDFLIVSFLFFIISQYTKHKDNKRDFFLIATLFLTISVLSFFVDKMKNEIAIVIVFLIVALFVMAVLSIYLITKTNRVNIGLSLDENYLQILAALFFVTAHFSVFIFGSSPYMPLRALNTFNFFILLTVMILVNVVFLHSSENRKNSFCLGVIFLLCIPYFLFSYTRFTYAMMQTDVQAKIREELIYQAKVQNRDEAEIPDWYFTKLAKENDKFDLWRSEFMPQYYAIRKIVWKPVNFNYAILKTKQPLIENAQLTAKRKMRLFYNDSNTFFDEPCFVFEFEEPFEKNAKIQFRFYRSKKEQLNIVVISEDDICQFGNHCYYVVRTKDIGLQDIAELKGIEIMADSEKITLLRQ